MIRTTRHWTRGLLVMCLQSTLISQSLAESPAWKDLLSPPEYSPATLIDVRVPMRDGVSLSADVYLPGKEGQWPVILERTPYGNSSDWYVNRALYFARRGYVYVLQDCRGRFDSDGKWSGWIVEIEDGRDTLDWCGTRSWSDGNVGMMGMSHMGLTQWKAAQTGSPYLKAIAPQMGPADEYLYGMNYTGGAFLLQIGIPWSIGVRGRTQQTRQPYEWDKLFRHLPILTADVEATGKPIGFYRDWIEHPSYDEFWKKASNYGHFGEMDIPILQVSGWLDLHAKSLFANYEAIQREGTERAKRLQKVVVGPWVHTDHPKQAYGVLDFGVDSIIDLYALYLRWMDRWLKGIENGVENEPPLKLFMMGKNRWRTAEKWPLPETRWTPFYLRSGGRANSLFGDGTLSLEQPPAGERADRYTYNPEDPVPTLGMDPNGEVAPLDHRPVEYRDDVLVYSTEALEEELEVTGPIQASIYASSSALDTDWTVKLLDVYPDGKAVNLWDGILRARYRDPAAIRAGVPAPGQFENPKLLKPGKIYKFFIEVGVVSNVFLKGHKIRVEVSSSNFPRFDRNLNNGGKLGVDTKIVLAHQTVYHDPEHPSHILLPIIPERR